MGERGPVVGVLVLVLVIVSVVVALPGIILHVDVVLVDVLVQV